jgi:hypothetical protein
MDATFRCGVLFEDPEWDGRINVRDTDCQDGRSGSCPKAYCGITDVELSCSTTSVSYKRKEWGMMQWWSFSKSQLRNYFEWRNSRITLVMMADHLPEPYACRNFCSCFSSLRYLTTIFNYVCYTAYNDMMIMYVEGRDRGLLKGSNAV